MSVTLIRHAPTLQNAERVFMGQRDGDLDFDLLYARGVARHAPPVVYSSPLARASVTAQQLFPDSVVVLDGRLRERGLGLWEGAPHEEVAENWPHAFRDGVLDAGFTPPDGETLDEFGHRIRGFLWEAESNGLPCVAVTHNGWIRTALWICGQIGYDEIFGEAVPFMTDISVGAPSR